MVEWVHEANLAEPDVALCVDARHAQNSERPGETRNSVCESESPIVPESDSKSFRGRIVGCHVR
jgi:hypothetical protein